MTDDLWAKIHTELERLCCIIDARDVGGRYGDEVLVTQLEDGPDAGCTELVCSSYHKELMQARASLIEDIMGAVERAGVPRPEGQ